MQKISGRVLHATTDGDQYGENKNPACTIIVQSRFCAMGIYLLSGIRNYPPGMVPGEPGMVPGEPGIRPGPPGRDPGEPGVAAFGFGLPCRRI